MRKKKEIQEPSYYLVHLIDKEGHRWYSPRLVEACAHIDAVKVNCREVLRNEPRWTKAEISELTQNVVATVE